MSGRQFVYLSVLVSVLLHFSAWMGVQLLPPFDFGKTHPKDDSVEVSVVTKKEEKKATDDLKRKIVVRQALPPLDQLKPELPKEPKYLSENDQNVVRQMQAKLPGLTQNRNETTTLPSGPEGAQSTGEPALAQSNDGFGPKNPQRPGNNEDNRLRDLGNQLFQLQSTSGEYLPEVSEGPITALNTERFVYYSFFARIEERIRPLWERNVRDAQLRLPMSVQKQVLNHDWITSLEILIDSKGITKQRSSKPRAV